MQATQQKENTYIKPSPIHGLGLFADRNIKEGEEITQPLKADLNRNIDEWIKYNRTGEKSFSYLKGFCLINHSEEPNTKRGDELAIIASKDICEGEEITEDYNLLEDDLNPFKNTLERELFNLANQ